jgi:hypothetical protein
MEKRERLEVINFTNITDKEWTHTFGGKPYTFAPGQTKAFPRFMAEFFAKHLGDRILLDEGKDFSMETKERKDITEKILGKVAVPAQEIIAETEVKEEIVFEEKPVEEVKVEETPKEVVEEVSAEPTPEPKKRGGRRKKA